MFDSSSIASLADRTGGVDCDVNIGGTGLAAIWVMVTLAFAVVAARIFTQVRITKQLGLSDYLMICSITIIIGFASLISVQYHFGWGRHQACITDLETLITQIKFNVTGQSFGIMGSTFGRLSFIAFMLTLFGSKLWVRWTLRSLFVAQIVTNVATVVIVYAQCRDPRALYDFTLPEDLCWPSYIQTVSARFFLQDPIPKKAYIPLIIVREQYLGWAHTAFNGACDAFLSVMPTVMVWNLHMATRLKVGVAVLLGMSCLGLVGLVMKCVYLDALSYEGDYSYNTVPMFTWIVVEGTLVAIAASLPLLRPLVKRNIGTRATAGSYDLPRYAYPGGRSGHTDSSGFSRLDKTRTSVKTGGSRRVSSYALRSLDGDDSDENVLVLQDLQERQGRMQQGLPGNPGREGFNGKIVVRQDYTVTSEDKEAGLKPREKRRGEPSPGGLSESDQSLEGEGPRLPPSIWSRER